MPVTEGDIRAVMAAEGFGGDAPAAFIEEVWREGLGNYGWLLPDARRIDLGAPLAAYDPLDVAWPASHVDALAWACIGRAAFRTGQHAAAVYAQARATARLADAVRVYAYDRVTEGE